MGALSFATIVSEGLQLAGNTSLSTRGGVWLNAWLAATYNSYPWPFLGSRSTINLAAGTTLSQFGDGATISEKVDSIRRIEISDSNRSGSYKRDLELDSFDSVGAEDDPYFILTSNTGVPIKATLVHVTADPPVYKWGIYWNPVPDNSYIAAVTFQLRPADISDTTKKPQYPNDQTMIHAVYVQALRHQADERWQVESGALEAMVRADRVTYGRQPGSSPGRLRLSSRVFRGRR